MTTWRRQQRMQRTRKQPFCFSVLLTRAMVVTVLGVVSVTSTETNRSDAFANNGSDSATTSSIGSSDQENIPYNTTALPPIPDIDVPISFSIYVAGFSDEPAQPPVSITNSNTNISSNNVVTNDTTTFTNDANTISDTNTNSDNHTLDITSPIPIMNSDYTRNIGFLGDINYVNFTDVVITHNTVTSTRMNVTDPTSENYNPALSITTSFPTINITASPAITSTNITDSTSTIVTDSPVIVPSNITGNPASAHTNITGNPISAITVSPDNTPTNITGRTIGCALTACQQLHLSNATALGNVSWWTAREAEDWVGFDGATAGGRRLASDMRLHVLATVEEAVEWTVLCVGAVSMATFSRRDATAAMPDAVFEVHTAREVPVGLVRLRTRCWLDARLFSECSPSFIPMGYVKNLPFYDLSPFDEAFWVQLTDAVVEAKATWIRGMNVTTLQGSITPQWISNMHIPSLGSLHITGNDWNYTEEILGNLSQLVRLDLSNNNIKYLPEDIFEDIQLLENLVLNKNSLSKCPTSISRLTKLLNLDLSNSVGSNSLRIEEEDIKLFPKSLQRLDVSNSKLQAYLEVILLLPELYFLNISRNRVKMYSVPSSTSKVKVLDVSENSLRITPDNFFSAMPALEILILNRNHLYELPIFSAQNNLTHLYASGNLLVSLSPRTFAHLKKLQVLDVSHCRLDFLELAFVNTISLKNVYLSHNFLRDIPEYLFSFLPELQEVDLSYNYLNTVYLWKWKLRILDLSSNRLNNFCSNISAIEYVNLSFNHMQNIDNILSSVQKLNISHNSLTYLSPELWDNISQSVEVDLGGNYFLCCTFENTVYLNYHYYTEILNLGSAKPIKCYINSEVSEVLFQTHFYDGNQCRTTEESITTFVVVLPLLIAITLTAVLVVLTLFVIQFNRRKFIVKHSFDTVIRNTTM